MRARDHAAESRADTQGRSHQLLSKALGSPVHPSTAQVLHFQRLAGNSAVTRVLAADQESATHSCRPVLQRTFEDLKEKSGVYYTQPAMTQADGFTRMTRISRRDRSVLDDMITKRPAQKEDDRANLLRYEWGLAEDRSGSGEVILVAGQSGAVNWERYLVDSVVLAHHHPYLDAQFVVRGVKGLRKTGSIQFRDLVQPHRARNVDEANDSRLMVLPSVGDVRFTALQKIARHLVFTPYAVWEVQNGDKPVWYVADHSIDLSLDPTIVGVALPKGPLSFALEKSHDMGSTDNAKPNYGSKMVAQHGTGPFWSGFAIAYGGQSDTQIVHFDPELSREEV